MEAARANELLYFHAKGVWMKVPKSSARQHTGRPPVTARWVDVNKGDEQTPNYRSRLVVCQLKPHGTRGETYFALPEPLEALGAVLSLAMACVGSHQPDWNPTSETRVQISLVDIKRVAFQRANRP